MKCKYIYCHNESKGSSVYCSNSCRAKESRRNRTGATSEAQHTSATSYEPDTEWMDAPLGPIPVRTRVGGCSVAIPGDEDYTGVCQKIDGVWQVVKPESIEPKDMTREQLYQAIRSYPNDQWITSPEHKELQRRLNTMTIGQLRDEGYWIPVRKRTA